MTVKVRFPPSPTGIPHIGNTRTALFNYLFAKHNKGKFVLRIEDTDRARLVEGAEEAIKEILSWLGIEYDEFYRQSERLDLYKKAADHLIDRGFARREEGAVRFAIPKGKVISWIDGVGQKHISFKSDDIEDFIILKSDGYPTYHLANVIDDHDMEITHVMRGDEWISSTPKHILLYESFGWQHPQFVHLPVILGADHSKLSKRHGADSALVYREKGYLKEALINYMALLGWNPGNDREIMSVDEMIELFDIAEINTASPIFDPHKLDWMNGVYIREKLSTEKLKAKLLDFYKNDDNIGSLAQNDSVLTLAQTRMTTLADFKTLVEKENAQSASDDSVKQELAEEFGNLNEWSKEKIFEVFKKIMEKHKIRMPVFYRIFTGRDQGLPLPDFLEALGKSSAVGRLKS